MIKLHSTESNWIVSFYSPPKPRHGYFYSGCGRRTFLICGQKKKKKRAMPSSPSDKISDLDLFQKHFKESVLAKNISTLNIASVLYSQKLSAKFCAVYILDHPSETVPIATILKAQPHLKRADVLEEYLKCKQRQTRRSSKGDARTARPLDEAELPLHFYAIKYICIFILFIALNYYCTDSIVQLYTGKPLSTTKSMEEIANEYRRTNGNSFNDGGHGFARRAGRSKKGDF